MRHQLLGGLSALALTLLPLAAGTVTLTLAGAETAVAGGGNGNGGGNGGGNGNGRGNGGGNGRGNGGGQSAEGDDDGPGRGNGNGNGAMASQLKGLNACHASDQARANASETSRVGQLAAYQTATAAIPGLEADSAAKRSALASFDQQYATQVAGIEAQYAGIELTLPENQTLAQQRLSSLAAAKLAYDTARVPLAQAVTDAEAAEGATRAAAGAALAEAADGRTVTPEMQAALDACLGG